MRAIFEKWSCQNTKTYTLVINSNIAKGTTDPRVEFILQVLTQILIKFHLQNLEQVSTSRSQPNMNISTKVKLKNIDQTKPQNLDLDSTL